MNIKNINNQLRVRLRNFFWELLKKTRRTTVVNTSKFKLRIYTADDVVGKNFFFYGEYGIDELKKAYSFIIEKKIYSPGAFLDIGANIGFMALYALSEGLADKAICFEPDGDNFELLKRNIQLNGFGDKASTYQVALASKKTAGQLIISSDNFGDHRVYTDNELVSPDKYNKGDRKIQSVSLDTLDNISSAHFGETRIEFVCLDVQGFELEVLKGGEKLFSTGPKLMMEVDPYLIEKKGGNCSELTSVLSRYYSKFVDLSDKIPGEREIINFPDFYTFLKQSRIQHKDVLFFKS